MSNSQTLRFHDSHYANKPFHSLHGNSCIEEKLYLKGFLGGKFHLHYAAQAGLEMGLSIKWNETFCDRGRDRLLWRLVT